MGRSGRDNDKKCADFKGKLREDLSPSTSDMFHS